MAQDDTATTPGEEEANEDTQSLTCTLDDLIHRANTILTEIETFTTHLRHMRQSGKVDLASYRSMVKSELAMLHRLQSRQDPIPTTSSPATASPPTTTTTAGSHIARSSNLPFLERIWTTVKQSRDVVSIGKRIYPAKTLSQRMRRVKISRIEGAGVKGNGVVVDAVVEGGRQWVKVSLVTNQRLLFDLAKMGWVSDGSSMDGEETGSEREGGDDDGPRVNGHGGEDGDDDIDVPLIRTAKALTSAAKCFRVRTRTPRVVLILPRIRLGETKEIDDIISVCEKHGAIVRCGASTNLNPAPTITASLETMAPDPLTSLTSTLNIDCTVLLALVSDFSHSRVAKQPWFHSGLRLQVEVEDKENLLPSILYPVLVGRELVCTTEAAKRMREIVETIGTASEKARTAILLDPVGGEEESRVEKMQHYSAHLFPSLFCLPISVIPSSSSSSSNTPPTNLPLPLNGHPVIPNFSPINSSVFLHGWREGITTVTSNRAAVAELERWLEQGFDDLDEGCWPRIWVCPTARSLVGREKRGMEKGRRDGERMGGSNGEVEVGSGVEEGK